MAIPEDEGAELLPSRTWGSTFTRPRPASFPYHCHPACPFEWPFYLERHPWLLLLSLFTQMAVSGVWLEYDLCRTGILQGWPPGCKDGQESPCPGLGLNEQSRHGVCCQKSEVH